MAKVPKLTDRELSETWRYQKVRDQLHSAWDGDDWDGLAKRRQIAFAKSEQLKAQAALDYIARAHGVAAGPRARKKT